MIICRRILNKFSNDLLSPYGHALFSSLIEDFRFCCQYALHLNDSFLVANYRKESKHLNDTRR